jgi:hypothetical protein
MLLGVDAESRNEITVGSVGLAGAFASIGKGVLRLGSCGKSDGGCGVGEDGGALVATVDDGA